MLGTKRKRLDWQPEAIAELAESLAWYAARNPSAAKRMRKVIEEAAHSLIASPIAVLVASVWSLAHANYRSAIACLSR